MREVDKNLLQRASCCDTCNLLSTTISLLLRTRSLLPAMRPPFLYNDTSDEDWDEIKRRKTNEERKKNREKKLYIQKKRHEFEERKAEEKAEKLSLTKTRRSASTGALQRPDTSSQQIQQPTIVPAGSTVIRRGALRSHATRAISHVNLADTTKKQVSHTDRTVLSTRRLS